MEFRKIVLYLFVANKNLLNYLLAPNSHVLAFQQQAIINLHKKHTCKSHTASSENYLYLLLNNTWFGYWIPIWSCVLQKLFKSFSSKFTVVTFFLHAMFARFRTNVYSKFSRFLATTAKKWVIWGPELRL